MQRRPAIVSFDRTCALCRASVAWLQRLDWLGRFRFVAIEDLPRVSPPLALPPAERLQQALHVFCAGQPVLSGARALRYIGLRLPLLALPSSVLLLPPILGWAEQAYRWISARRHGLGRRFFCPSGACHAQAPIEPPEGGSR